MILIEATSYFTIAKEELAQTTAQIIWHAQHTNYAVVLSILPGYAPWYHLFIEIEGEWLPVTTTFANWIAYDTSQNIGVFVDLAPVHQPIKQGRVSYQGQIVESQGNENYLCTVIWDIDRPNQENAFNYVALLIQESWEASLVSWTPVTAHQFAVAYLEYHNDKTKENKDKNWWAVEMLMGNDREEKLKLLLTIIDYADLSNDSFALGCIGAGPLEDLMSHWLLDRLEARILNDLKLRYALSIVRMENEDKNLQHRVAKFL